MARTRIRDWPEKERPRERLEAEGPSSLSDAHLLAILLRTGGGGRSAVDLGIELLGRFGSLRDLDQAAMTELCSLSGVGRAKAAQLKAALELGKRLFQETGLAGPVFSSGGAVHAYFLPKLRSLRKETFWCAMLDAKNRLIREHRVSEGSLTSTIVHPRDAFREAVRESAAAVIFVHNHPSGDPAPSRDDLAVTERLAQAGEAIGIPVLDHVIVAEGGFASMLERGLLRRR